MLPLLNNRYRVLQELADGGFGRAFLAEDTHVPSMKKCVIKQLKPIADDPQVHQLVKDRFQREAALLEALGEGHNQIPKLYAYFSDADQFYLVEEWVQGQTLTQKVRQQGFLSEETVQALLVDLLQILEYIETRGIIHRDIKPDNIIVREADQKPVLIDFGAVKETLGTVVTQSGNSTRSIIVGTPGFMPSEQSIGRPVFSSDLYSLGLTAIFLLTAKFPQELGNDPRTGEILWRQFAPTISPAFAAVLDKAIQSHARDRYINAKAMLEAMRAIASPVLPPTVPILPSNPPSPPVYPSNPPNSPVYPSNPPNSPVYPSNPPNPPNPPVYPSHPPSPYAPAASPTPYYAPTPGQSPPTRMDVPASPAQGYYQGSGYPQAFAGPSNTGLMGGGGTFNTNAPVPP
jgi:serine/threonine-protein kinase